MKTFFNLTVILSVVFLQISCSGGQNSQENTNDTTPSEGTPPEADVPQSDLLAKNNLMAWCIVPFDSKKRGPAERVQVLAELGITKYAWDWRDEHLDILGEEIDLLKENNIELSAVWYWVHDEVFDGKMEKILNTLKEKEVKTTFWVSFNNGFYEGLSDEESLEKAVGAIGAISERATEMGCRVGLYNHGGWFGEPENQLRIIEKLAKDNIGIIYNFHHAHHQIEGFEALMKKMEPHLFTVCLNGMDPNGEKILPIGKGTKEKEMIATLLASGYDGPVGVLGHVDTEDVKLVLERNLNGLKGVLEELGQEQAAATF